MFGFASGAQSAKPVFFPTEEVLWRGRRTTDGFDASTPDPPGAAPYALLGVRSCDLHAVGIHDTVLTRRGCHDDVAYAARRGGAFVVAVTCSDPAAPASACRWAPDRGPSRAGARRSTWR